jgi:hypothetical protein
MRKSLIAALFIVCGVFAAGNSLAQCKAYSKKFCIPVMSPYNHNGKMSNIILSQGETAELNVTFFSGQEYRLVICGQEILGKVNYRLLDKNRKEIFNSENNSELFFDFNVASTQQFILEVSAPASVAKNGLMQTGCVSVLVGFKR